MDEKSGQGFVLDHALCGWMRHSCPVYYQPVLLKSSVDLCHMAALLHPLFLAISGVLSQSPISCFGAGNGIPSGLALLTLIAGRGKVLFTSSPQLDGTFWGKFHLKGSITMLHLI